VNSTGEAEMRNLFILFGLLMFSGCATDYCGVKTPSGNCIGSGDFINIEIEESKLQATPDIIKRVKNIKARSLYSLYQEAIYLNNGIFTLDKALSGGFLDAFNETEFRQLVSSWTAYGQKIDGQALDIKRKNSVNYAFFDRPNKKCLFGQVLLGQSRELINGAGRPALIKGFICIPDTNESSAFLEEFVVALNHVELK
jgi:hypothetical protein